MRKIVLFFLLIVSELGLAFICKAQDIQPWTSMDSSSIPLNIRQQWYRKGNLVLNSSFEQSEIFKSDSSHSSFKLAHWKVVGKDVQLTNITKGGNDSAEVFQGKHAIKIVRSAKEVKKVNNKPEGVVSDFISVIPGNYDFHFQIRLKNVNPLFYPQNRFQERIKKGIAIYLKFYDKNKKEINPWTYFEYTGKKVNNGFKGFAFSNYFYIKNFNWGWVRGETWHYPFSEGGLPDNCRYVKIFLGLACAGTMWIDDIDFHLSRWNFTPLERTDSFFTKKYDLTDLMIPMPRFVSNKKHLSLKNKSIQFIYDGTGLSKNNPALALLREKFHTRKENSLRSGHSKTNMPSEKLQIILINRRQPISSSFDNEFHIIKGKSQGYFIKRKGNKIYLGANQSVGWFNAACSLTQLIDHKNDMLDYADIIDYPDFTGRSALLFSYQNKWTLEQNKALSDSAISARLMSRDKQLQQQLKDIDFYAYYKLNDFYSLYFNLSKRWWRPGNFYKKYFDTIGTYCSAKYPGIIRLGVQINPYFHINMEVGETTLSDSLKKVFSHGTEGGFDKITNVLKTALDAGAKTVMLCADDYIPHIGPRGVYTLFTKSDKEQFTNLAAAQSYLLNKLQEWVNKNYGHVRIEFVPPNYNNWFIDYSRGTAQSYFRDLTRHLDSSIVLVWTGSVIRSLSYDMADLHRITTLYREKPMIWDNSPYARALESKNGGYPMNYPGKSILCNLFEPFDIEYPKNFPSYLNSHYYSNNGGSGEINKIKNMTFADFTWNTKDYNPDFSLFKALVRLFGKENAKLLLVFNDAYFKFVSTWGQLRMNLEHHADFTLSAKQRKEADMEIKNMKNAFSDLQSIDNETLKKELKNIMDRKIKEWNKLVNKTS